MAIVVPILTEYSNKGLKQAYNEISRADDKFRAFGKTASLALGGAAAAAGAFAIKLGVDAVQAAVADEEAMRGLAKTLDNLNLGYRDTAVEDFISKLSLATGEVDDNLRPAFERLVRSTEDVGLAQTALQVALDASIASGKSLQATSAAIGKAYDGNTQALARLGLGIDSATLKSGDMNRIMSELARLTGGQAADAADTYAGRLRLMQVAADEASEAIGYSLLQALDTLTQGIDGGRGAAGAITDLGDTVASFIGGINVLIGKLESLVPKVEDTADATGDAADAQLDWLDALLNSEDPLSFVGNLIFNAGNNAAVAAGQIQVLADRYTGLANAAAAAAAAQAAAAQQRAQSAVTDRYTALAVQKYQKSISFTGGTLRDYLASLHAVNRASSGSSSGGSSSTGGTAGATNAMSKAAEKAQKAYDKLAQSVEDTKTALSDASSELKDAQDALESYLKGYGDWLRGGVSIGDAFAKQLTTAEEIAKLDQAIADAIAGGDGDAIKKATDARAAVVAKDWTASFLEQIASAENAAAMMDALRKTLDPLNTRGNELLVGQLMQMDPSQAAAVAKDLVDRGLGPTLAQRLASFDYWAGTAGEAWASSFYSSGVTAAESQYAAIAATLESKLNQLYALGKKMGDKVAAGFADSIRGLPAGIRIPGAQSASTMSSESNVYVTVQAGVGDPVAIARTIEATLKAGRRRMGTR